MPFDLNNIDIHLFDCDGILLDSNSLKVSALEECLMHVGAPKKFIDYSAMEFRANFGKTRDEHFKSFQNIASEFSFRFSSEALQAAKKKYAELVVDLYKKSQPIESTVEFISNIHEDEKIFVVSASDQSELRDILPLHIPRISKNHIFGGPVSKSENIGRIIKKHDVKNAVLYGDSVQDGLASLRNKIQFCGVTGHSADGPALELFCIKNGFDCLDNCMEILS